MPAASPTTSARSKLRGRPLALVAGTRPGKMMSTLLWLRTRAEKAGDNLAVAMIDATLADDPRAQLRAVVGGDVTLSRRQWDVLECVWRAVCERGVSPTYQEIGDTLGVTKTTVCEYVRELIGAGVICKGHGARSLRVVPHDERATK